jgi:hypothetical protein
MNSKGTEYAFDCVGLIKAYYWNWNGGKTDYKSNQDVSANGMYNRAKVKGNIKTMPEIEGLLVQMNGHIGIYIGDGYVIECTPSIKFAKQSHKGGGVCKTKLSDRKWTHWLECPFIAYEKETEEEKHKRLISENAKQYGMKVPTSIKKGQKFWISRYATFYGGASLGVAIPEKVLKSTDSYTASKGTLLSQEYKGKTYKFVLAKELNSYVRIDEIMVK